MADIIITESMDGEAVRRLAHAHETLYDPELVDQPNRLHAQLATARAVIIGNRTKVGEVLLSMAPKLRVVGYLGTGVDTIDVGACRARSIKVILAAGAYEPTVAEYVMTSALMLVRGAWSLSAETAAGGWPRHYPMGRDLAGKTIGLIGFGPIAQEVAWRAHMMGMQILACDADVSADHPGWQIARNVSLDSILELSDVVSLHTSLTERNRRMIDAGALAKMKPHAALINTAHGGLVDEAALADALKAGALGGAALDVFETEPLTAADGAKFAGLSNCLLTPHIAGATVESSARVGGMIADRILEALVRRT